MICKNGPSVGILYNKWYNNLYFYKTIFKDYYSHYKYFNNWKTTRSNFELGKSTFKKNKYPLIYIKNMASRLNSCSI